jgi:polysaccharide export outer membrane protein
LTFRLLEIVFLLAAATFASDVANPQLAERDPRYRLQPSDVVELQYRYTPEYNQSFTIQPDGFAELQLLGAVKLQGLTLEEARAVILKAAAARLRDPEISLILKDFVKPYFVVAGEVEHPGRYEMRGPVTGIQAIAMAGGFKNSAKHSQVILYRRVSPESARAQLLNLKQTMQHPDEDVDLRSGDLLVIHQNRVSKIERFVKWGNLGVYWNPARP